VSNHLRYWNLGDEEWATISLPNKLTKRNVKRLIKYVAALEAEAAIAWEDELLAAVSDPLPATGKDE
jgi:hypothetical protein